MHYWLKITVYETTRKGRWPLPARLWTPRNVKHIKDYLDLTVIEILHHISSVVFSGQTKWCRVDQKRSQGLPRGVCEVYGLARVNNWKKNTPFDPRRGNCRDRPLLSGNTWQLHALQTTYGFVRVPSHSCGMLPKPVENFQQWEKQERFTMR